MKVLLVNPKTEKYTRSGTAPLGLLSIASVLEAAGHSVRLYDRTVEKSSVGEIREQFRPDVAGVSLVSFKSVNDALAVSEYFKKSGLPVIWGGPLATELPEAVLKHDCVDAVSLGEGEYTWRDIADALSAGSLDFTAISGLCCRGVDGSPVYTPERGFIDLGELPPVDWSLIDVEKYFQSSYGCSRMLYLYAAKGCPFNCAFCYNRSFHKSRYRKRPLDDLIAEIEFLTSNYGMDGVYFADELWCADRAEMHEICDRLRAVDADFVWGCQTRIGIFEREDFAYMFESGCRWIFFGVESGSKRVLELMNKRINYDRIAQTFSDATAAGIISIGSFIAGFPGETEDDFRDTVGLISTLDTPMINLNFFTLVPGSDISKKLTDEHKISPILDITDMNGKDPLSRLAYNYSDVPDIDLKVVRAYYMWRSFSAGSLNAGDEKSSFTLKVIVDAVKSVIRSSGRYFIPALYNAGTEFLTTFFYANCFPRVKKKYGIK